MHSLVALRIIGIVVFLGLALGLQSCRRDSRKRHMERPIARAERLVAESLEAYFLRHGKYPATLAELRITNFPNGLSTSCLDRFSYSNATDESRNLYGYDLQIIGRESLGPDF